MDPFDWIMPGAALLAVAIAIWAVRQGRVWIGRVARVAAHILSVGATIGVFYPTKKADKDKAHP